METGTVLAQKTGCPVCPGQSVSPLAECWCRRLHPNSVPTPTYRAQNKLEKKKDLAANKIICKTNLATIITFLAQRDCPVPTQLPVLIGLTAGYQERKHRGITQQALLLLMATVSVVQCCKQMHQRRRVGSGLQHLCPPQCWLVFWHYDWHSELGWVTSCLRGSDRRSAVSKTAKDKDTGTTTNHGVTKATTRFSPVEV